MANVIHNYFNRFVDDLFCHLEFNPKNKRSSIWAIKTLTIPISSDHGPYLQVYKSRNYEKYLGVTIDDKLKYYIHNKLQLKLKEP